MIKYDYIGDLKLWQTEKRSLQTKSNDRRKTKYHRKRSIVPAMERLCKKDRFDIY